MKEINTCNVQLASLLSFYFIQVFFGIIFNLTFNKLLLLRRKISHE